jgi:hypothetical protein
MGVLSWDAIGQHLFETGVDRGVLYRADGSGDYTIGYAWNGLTTVTESPTGGEASAQYADNIKYLNLISVEEYAGTIEAFTYPDAFAECDGSAQAETGVYVGQQPRKPFGFAWRTRVGNDLEGTELGYKIHMVWNAIAAPSEKAYTTINDSPEAMALSWEFWTTPIGFAVDGDYADLKPTAYLCVDSTKVAPADLAELEDFLYGTIGDDPQLPTPDAVLAIFNAALVLAIPPATIAYNSGTDIVTIPSTTGIIYKVDGVTVPAGAYGPITGNVLVSAIPDVGYYFGPTDQTEWEIVLA